MFQKVHDDWVFLLDVPIVWEQPPKFIAPREVTFARFLMKEVKPLTLRGVIKPLQELRRRTSLQEELFGNALETERLSELIHFALCSLTHVVVSDAWDQIPHHLRGESFTPEERTALFLGDEEVDIDASAIRLWMEIQNEFGLGFEQ